VQLGAMLTFSCTVTAVDDQPELPPILGQGLDAVDWRVQGSKMTPHSHFSPDATATAVTARV
jgi:hypothetical protein